MYFLGLEGSANKLGVGIISSEKKILANLRRTFIPKTGQGFLPVETASHHFLNIIELIDQALCESKIYISNLTAVCFTKGPGMGAPLQVVAIVARMLSLLLNLPLVPVNHCIAHIEMGIFICKMKNPIVLYVSGGNSQIIAFKQGKYRIFGETLDIAAGNCIDRAARALGISNNPNPGYNFELVARHGSNFYNLPYTVKGMDVAFSGLLSNSESLAESHSYCVSSIAFSVQETLFAMLTETTERALSIINADGVIIVGGVACNLRLQQMISDMCRDRGLNAGTMDERYCIDNGIMIAYAGFLLYTTCKQDWLSIESSTIKQRYRTDSVDVTWR